MQFRWAPREGLPCPSGNQAEILGWTLNSEFRSTGEEAEAEDTDVGTATVELPQWVASTDKGLRQTAKSPAGTDSHQPPLVFVSQPPQYQLCILASLVENDALCTQDSRQQP